MTARFAWMLIMIGLQPAIALAQPDPSPPEMAADAELAAVTFVDADRGWAVGDRGVIWHTADGGRNWKQQGSGVTCRLESIQFIDAENGIAVGGWTQTYTHETHGVVLRTRDGGRTWQNTTDLTLPGLKHVRLFDARQGWALGDGSPLYPAGVFKTTDGGRTWTPVPKGETLGWVTGDFRDPASGAVAGFGGTLGFVTSQEIRPTRTPNLGARYVQRMVLAGQLGGWLVGDGGLALSTSDGGYTWTAPPGPLPEAAVDLDFRAIAAHGNHVWIAGAPGTLVLHSPDSGRTWQAQRTEQTAPLRSLTFIDEYRGWAVGTLGTILHTRDGGQSWRVQRAGGTRVALLGIVSEAERTPLEVIAAQAGGEAFLTAVEIIGRHDQEPNSPLPAVFAASRRSHAAVVAAGGSAADLAWRFPLPDSDLRSTGAAIEARWNQANDGRAVQRLEEHLVRRIRQWQPDVIVTEDVSPRGDNPLAHITSQVTLAAVEKAADMTAYPEQLARTGLPVWKVKKVFTLLPPDKQGLVNITPAQWTPQLGRSIAEQAEAGRGLLVQDVRVAPQTIGLALLVDHLPQKSGQRDVMSGIPLQPGSEARRQYSQPGGANLEALRSAATKRHNVQHLLARIEADATVGAGWLGQVGDLTKGLSSRQAGEIVWQLGRKYQEVGKSGQAAEAFQLLIDKHPQHPLADAAALWLVQYYASGEVAWRERKETRFEVRLATAANQREETAASTGASTSAAEAPAIAGPRPAGVALASAAIERTAAPGLNPAERAGRAIALAKQIEQTRPTRYADPALRFSLATAARQAGQPRTADRVFQSLTASKSPGIWAQNAAAEHWLIHPHESPPKKLCSVTTAAAKPRLDGRLDDPIWKTGKPVALVSPAGDDAAYPAAAVLAFDDEYLYLAVSCGKAPEIDYSAAADSPRTPDSDLSNRDRVQFLIDVDRDYASCWSLTIDHRGWPTESCFGDATWNPQWYIAVGGDEQFWTAEAALPLAELAPQKVQVRDVWAIGIQRIIPGRGLQSFTQPAAVEPRPEGLGLMVFE